MSRAFTPHKVLIVFLSLEQAVVFEGEEREEAPPNSTWPGMVGCTYTYCEGQQHRERRYGVSSVALLTGY